MSERTITWQGHPRAPAPLGAIRTARRDGPVTIVDDAGQPVSLSTLRWMKEAVRTAWQRFLGLETAAMTAIFTSKTAPKVVPASSKSSGPVVVVLPVLPDMSHTFVYRELLAILKQRPDWRVIVLEHNEQAPRHREAEELLERATFLPRDGVTRAHARAKVWLLRRRGQQLVSMYRAQQDPQSRDLLGKQVLRNPRHPGNALQLADLLRPIQPRHIHVYASTWSANVAMGAAHLLDVPFSISSYVDFEFPYSHKLLPEKLLRATFFRVVTKFCQQRLVELQPNTPEQKVPVVYLGIDLDNWQDRCASPGRGVIVSAARIVEKKGLHLMPEALAQLQSDGIAFTWRVIGDGPELEGIRQLCEQHGIAQHVEFLGAQDNATVREALMHADAAVLPCIVASDGERDGIPIFFVEAMALGVPVVTTPISGIPELVRDGDTGFLHATSDAQALADKLTAVLRDPKLAQAVGARGRDEVHRTLDVHASATQLIALIEQ
ncbi:MAG: colanic acid/amylovoran biosynthesis glycosyltransferase [Planctomycetota bacterium]